MKADNQIEQKHVEETFRKQFTEQDFFTALEKNGPLTFGEPIDYEAVPERVFNHWIVDDFGQWYRGERDKAPQYKWQETIAPKKEDENPYRAGPAKDPPPYTKYRKPGLFDGRGILLIPERYFIVGWWK